MLNEKEVDLLKSIDSLVGFNIHDVRDIDEELAATLLKNMNDRGLIRLKEVSSQGITDEIIVGITDAGKAALKKN